MTVVMVTDASLFLTEAMCEKWAICLVLLRILLDGVDLRDDVDDIPYDVYKLPTPRPRWRLLLHSVPPTSRL
ncbi:hypothetical protein DIJ64_07945 [Mycobacterium leprae]|uniref:Uncharacterized protein n=1 Tax=Mycobacterium leprae TaxID=1769 RepID=A0AAD0P4Z1_MYCLR|nr:hypothetical protein [Mycobacterium leprae]AWV48020.1 hypothetical protein DIJ64_07945 [Mycobacterium leprae]